MKGKTIVIGTAVVGAILASACCIGPVLLAGLGLGAAGFGTALAPYRPYFLIFSAGMLALAWRRVLRSRPTGTSAGEGPSSAACCPATSVRRRNIIVMSAVTVIALGLMAFPLLAGALASARSQREPAITPVDTANGETVHLSIAGMTCEGCTVNVRKALQAVPGVIRAQIDLEGGSAVVLAHRSPTLIRQLEQAVAEAGYRATAASSSGGPAGTN